MWNGNKTRHLFVEVALSLPSSACGMDGGASRPSPSDVISHQLRRGRASPSDDDWVSATSSSSDNFHFFDDYDSSSSDSVKFVAEALPEADSSAPSAAAEVDSTPTTANTVSSAGNAVMTPEECFLCCDGGLLVGRVCKCRGMSMHLECQKKMLEAAHHARGGPQLRCGVCNAEYSNAEARSVWRLSMLGALWITCCGGVAVMYWSATTVLDRGSNSDPKLNYMDATWWSFQLRHVTWWRLVGLLYLGISLFMACLALGWVMLDFCGHHAGLVPIEPLCVRRYIVRVWMPTVASSSSGALSDPGAMSKLSGLFPWSGRRDGATLLL
jgi:hypothetical protein